MNLGKALIYTGDFVEAKVLLGGDLAGGSRDRSGIGRKLAVHINLAELNIYEGDWVEAEEHLDAAEALARENDLPASCRPSWHRADEGCS